MFEDKESHISSAGTTTHNLTNLIRATTIEETSMRFVRMSHHHLQTLIVMNLPPTIDKHIQMFICGAYYHSSRL